MQYRRLGTSGLQVSSVGLGTNNFGNSVDASETKRVIHQAIDIGINFLDTANRYSNGRSEEFIGESLRGYRHQVVLATKFAGPVGDGPNQSGGSRKHIMDQIDTSLSRLQTDYIDLYQIHFPDSSTPIEETLRALDDLTCQGKVRYIGCSNFSAWQTCEAVWSSRLLNLAPFISTQVQYNLLHREIERELIPFCQSYNIGIIPWLPLASGFLTGKYTPNTQPTKGTRMAVNTRDQQRFLTERNFLILGRLQDFAMERDKTVGDLAIAWLLNNPLVSSVIAGATKPEQVLLNAQGIEWDLTVSDMDEIRHILEDAPNR